MTRATEEALKEALLHERNRITEADITRTLRERQDLAERLNPGPDSKSTG